ncbi:MAG: sigma-54 dependent transcriptional regulator [Deltaproteobacteria bacterium]|nr:sigma-54 dependent transcriptional regulator [Deltaproteobacteria bacterium]
MIRTLIVDDDDLTRQLLAHVLERDGHEVVCVADGAEAIERLAAESFDLVVSDIQMAKTSGFELLAAVRRGQPDLPVILVTGYAEPAGAMDAIERGAVDYLAKPVDIQALRATAARAIERSRMPREPVAAAGEVGKRVMLSTSAPMLALYKQLAQVASTNAVVHIHGESGAGKELIARTVHARSRRASGPFVAVNCAALTESLLESELFGHERGAFTGAATTRRGLFEEAAGGTLVLDEIGDISPKVQGQLLRVLQEGEIRRVGGNTAIPVDARVVTATNRDLAADVAAGRMRQDLFYRLSVVTLAVPPLRERGDDLLVLARHFVARQAQELGRPAPALSEEAIAVLAAHRWPGNVRELENAMARAVAMCQGHVILATDLPSTVGAVGAPSAGAAGAIDADWPTLELLQQRYVDKVLAHTRQNKTAAAAVLGIDRRTLQRMPRP